MTSSVRVAWVSDFPVEWLEDVPPEVGGVARLHPLTWQRVLAEELAEVPGLELHCLVLRKHWKRDQTFRHRLGWFHLLRMPGGWRAPTLFWLDTWRMRRVLAGIGPRLVHAWGTEKGAALAASRLPFPYLVTLQGLIRWLAREVPVGPYLQLAARLEGLSLNRAPLATVESEFAVGYLKERHPRLDVLRVEHAPHPRFFGVERRPVLRPWRLLYVGRFNSAKGADVLCRALGALAEELDFELTVVGDAEGAHLEPLRRLASGGAWSRFHWRGLLTPDELVREMASAALLVFPSRADNSPNVVKEAVVAGVPVIATRTGGVPAYVAPGRNGVMVPPGDVEGWVAALRQVHGHPLLGRGMVEATWLEMVRDLLAPARMRRGFLAAYERLCPGVFKGLEASVPGSSDRWGGRRRV